MELYDQRLLVTKYKAAGTLFASIQRREASVSHGVDRVVFHFLQCILHFAACVS